MREDHATGVGHIDHYYCQASLPTWSSGVAACNHVRSRESVPGGNGSREGTYTLRRVTPLTSRALRPVPQPELATPRTGRAVRYRRNRWRSTLAVCWRKPEPRAPAPRPDASECALRPALAGSVSRNLLSGTEESRCPRSGRPGTDAVRCRHITSQACAALLHTNVKPNYMNTGAKTKTPKFVTQQTAPSLRRRGRGAGREIDARHPEIGRPC